MSLIIKSIEYYLPVTKVTNEDLQREHPSWDLDKITAKSGVLQRHIAGEDETAYDLSLKACEKLFQKKTSADPGWGLSHCFACSQRIRKGMLFPEDQVAFCERCFHSTPCWCCHLPCGPLHRRLSDERIVCQHCYSPALLSPRQLGPL